MRFFTIYLLSAACLTCLCNSALRKASAVPVNLNDFTVENYPQANTFPLAAWLTTETTAQLDDDNPFASASNATANVFYGPDNVLGKRITGQLSPGNGTSVDDDVVGFALGFQPGDAGLFSGTNADFILIDWKGVDQTFDFVDVPGGFFFHEATLGGLMPAGLAASRVTGVPTADELWQHVDDEDGIDGGVTELARGLSLADVAYSRDPQRAPYEFDINYTASRVTVLVDGVLQLDVSGSFGDGRFGLYTLGQGPTPIYSNFDISDAVELPEAFPAVTVDRSTGELVIGNPGGSPTDFSSYSITSVAGSLNDAELTSISDNYDSGGPGTVDSDDWAIDVTSDAEIAESEVGGSDGATLTGGQEVSLGNIWTPSRFEDLIVLFDHPSGFSVPVIAEFVGNGGQPFERSDLNTDGQVNEADWLLFFPNTLADLSGMSSTQAALLGDLDGDLDNDVGDFTLFKEDFELANGSGSFATLIAAVPEPGTLVMLAAVFAALVWRRRLTCLLLILALFCVARPSVAQPLDFTQFTLESYPRIEAGFPEATWTTTPGSATVTDGANTAPSVLYSPTNLIGNRIHGFLEPGTDDDVVGMVIGFQPGDATYDPPPSNADYLVLDWKGIDQSYNFGDPSMDVPPFNALTGTGFMPAGLGLSRVSGLPTMDELWQHADLVENDLGGVEELARANTLGFQPYDRFSDPLPAYEFDIIWRPNQLLVVVDGELEFNVTGDFSDGRFGVYTCCQSGGPIFRDFEVLEADSLDLSTVVPFAVVDRQTGDIVISNGTPDPLQFDFYQFGSNSGSLLSSWQGLADAESGADAGPGVSWVEAGGSDSGSLGELFLQGPGGLNEGLTLNTGESFTLSGAYNTVTAGEDLSLFFRELDGTLSSALVEYEGTPPVGLPGDYNEDGFVNAADYSVWRDGLGTTYDQNDYDTWKANFGATASSSGSSAPVPEPSGLLLLAAATLIFFARRS